MHVHDVLENSISKTYLSVKVNRILLSVRDNVTSSCHVWLSLISHADNYYGINHAESNWQKKVKSSLRCSGEGLICTVLKSLG